MRRKKKKSIFTFCRKKQFLSVKFFVIAIVLVGLATAAAIGYKIVYGKNAAVFGKQTASISEENSASESIIYSAPESPVTLASSSAPSVSYLTLSNDVGVYVLSKKSGPCKDYRNTFKSNAFGFRCKTDNAFWRGYWTKKIDVAGYSKLRINAYLEVNDYTDYFAECGHKGTNRDDFVDLIALSSDPEPKLDAECNHVVGPEKWSECYIDNKDVSAVAHCGVSKCSSGRGCNMEIDVSGREAMYLLFSVTDAWTADIEGVLSNVEISLTK